MKIGPILSPYTSNAIFSNLKSYWFLLFISHLEKHINKQYFPKQSIKNWNHRKQKYGMEF